MNYNEDYCQNHDNPSSINIIHKQGHKQECNGLDNGYFTNTYNTYKDSNNNGYITPTNEDHQGQGQGEGEQGVTAKPRCHLIVA